MSDPQALYFINDHGQYQRVPDQQPATPTPSYDPNSPHPREAALDLAQKAMAKGARFEEAAGLFLRRLAASAQSGDPRPVARNLSYQLVDESGNIVSGEEA